MQTPTPLQVESSAGDAGPETKFHLGRAIYLIALILTAVVVVSLMIALSILRSMDHIQSLAYAAENEATIEQWKGGVAEIVRTHCFSIGGALHVTVNFQLGMVYWLCEPPPMPNTPRKEA